MNNKEKIYIYDKMISTLIEQEKYEDALKIIANAIELIPIISEWNFIDKNIAHFYFKNLAKNCILRL